MKVNITENIRYIFLLFTQNIVMNKNRNIVEEIKNTLINCEDVFFREVKKNNRKATIIFSDAMTDSNLISNFVIRSILDIFTTSQYDIEEKIDINKIKEIDLESEDISVIYNLIFSGFCIIVIDKKVYAVETKANLTRSITEPTSDTSILGSRDSFVENIMQNLGMIRNRIKSERLVYKEHDIGRKTKTKVSILYVDDIVKEELVDYVEEKLEKIDIDGILDINYIQEFIEESNESSFPISLSTQRPDVSSYYLLQGRVILLVNNCPYALILPAFFEDYVNNIDDLYQRSRNVTITKIIRYISLVITIMIPALYLSLITFDPETIPSMLLGSFASQREGVPFPAFFEALLMIISFEILRESDMRANKISGNTLSIVGALILGDAAVSAGIVSPIMIIVVAITTISGLMFSDINVVNAMRKWRIIYMLLASVCGIIGMELATIFLVTSLVETRSYTFPFTYPIAPIDFTQIKKNFLSRENISKDKTRQKILTNNIVKSR